MTVLQNARNVAIIIKCGFSYNGIMSDLGTILRQRIALLCMYISSCEVYGLDEFRPVEQYLREELLFICSFNIRSSDYSVSILTELSVFYSNIR
jgi:hypothetical protein